MIIIYCVALPHQCESLPINKLQIITEGAVDNEDY